MFRSLCLCLFFVGELCFCQEKNPSRLFLFSWTTFYRHILIRRAHKICLCPSKRFKNWWQQSSKTLCRETISLSLRFGSHYTIHTWRGVSAYVWWWHLALLLYTRYDLNEINSETALKYYFVYQRYGLPLEAQLCTLPEWMSLYFVNSDCPVSLHYFVQYLCVRYSF